MDDLVIGDADYVAFADGWKTGKLARVMDQRRRLAAFVATGALLTPAESHWVSHESSSTSNWSPDWRTTPSGSTSDASGDTTTETFVFVVPIADTDLQL